MLQQNINNYIFIPLLIFFLFLQLTFIPQLFFNTVHPNLVLMLLIAASFLFKSSSIFYAVFFCGFVLDIFSGIYFGPMLISFLLTIFISSYFSCRFLKEIFSVRLFLISIFTILIYNFSYFILINRGDFNKIINNCEAFLSISAFDMIYAALLIVPLLFVLSYKINIVKTNEK